MQAGGSWSGRDCPNTSPLVLTRLLHPTMNKISTVMAAKIEDDVLFSSSSDDVSFEREVIYISSDDEEDIVPDAQQQLVIPRPVLLAHGHDVSQLIISVDASCNGRKAAGTCVILEDATFGTRMKTLPVVPGDNSSIAELATITEAVRWACSLIQLARANGGCDIKTLTVVSDCMDMVQRWQWP